MNTKGIKTLAVSLLAMLFCTALLAQDIVVVKMNKKNKTKSNKGEVVLVLDSIQVKKGGSYQMNGKKAPKLHITTIDTTKNNQNEQVAK